MNIRKDTKNALDLSCIQISFLNLINLMVRQPHFDFAFRPFVLTQKDQKVKTLSISSR